MEILSPGAEENQAILVSSPADFAAILRRATGTSNQAYGYEARGNARFSVFEQLEWHALAALRPRMPVQAGWYPWPGNPHLRAQEPVRPFDAPTPHVFWKRSQLSFFDKFVRRHANKQERYAYRWALMRTCAARRWAGGSELVLRSYGWVLLLLTAAAVWRIAICTIR
jgi:hypothetical protein